ncbi:MAG: glycosyltransferase family 4 protein [Spirochaetia bacterium]|nr:glycosyltransferase family 4 protein [Spirochaetia bacterium]
MPLVRALRSQGYSVHLLTQYDDYIHRIEHEFDALYPLHIDRSGINPLRDLLTFANIFRILILVRPAVLLTFTIKPSIYGGVAGRVLGVQTISNITGLGAVFIKGGWLHWFVRRLYKHSLTGCRRVFFQNEDDRRLFIEDGLVRAELAGRVPGSGIDLTKFSIRRPLPRGSKKGFRFLLVARMLWDKGVGEFVDAARLLSQRYPDAEFCLLGFLDTQNPTAISREQMDEWAAEGIVKYLGVSDDVREEIEVADCVVLPSYREGVPRSLLEAAAMGRPIVTTDTTGCREVVDDGESGLLCKSKDADDLADKMERLFHMPVHELETMGRRGRKKMEREFDEKIVIERYLETIEEICG